MCNNTRGYTAPEYARHGLLSDKVDTFSLGIVILEIISGQRCNDVNIDGPITDYLIEHVRYKINTFSFLYFVNINRNSTKNNLTVAFLVFIFSLLLRYSHELFSSLKFIGCNWWQAWKLYENKEHMKLVDETMDARKYEEEHLMKIIEIALLCTQSPAINRPTMSEVLLMLQDGQSLGERQLTRPTYIDHNRRIHIGSIKNSIATGDLFQKQKGTETNEHVRINKADDQLDVMEKGTKVANIW